MSTVVAYIDGFNLYYGLKARHGRRYLWLDLEHLCRSLLQPEQHLLEVRYFTAPVRKDPDGLRRQQRFWNALRTHCERVRVEAGRFQEKTLACRSCAHTWLTHEEKESDVAIAVAMVEDAAAGSFDTALLVSADSDLCPAVRAVRRLSPNSKVVAAFPPGRGSDRLRRVADASFTIAEKKLKAALLPDVIVSARGSTVCRPTKWR